MFSRRKIFELALMLFVMETSGSRYDSSTVMNVSAKQADLSLHPLVVLSRDAERAEDEDEKNKERTHRWERKKGEGRRATVLRRN